MPTALTNTDTPTTTTDAPVSQARLAHELIDAGDLAGAVEALTGALTDAQFVNPTEMARRVAAMGRACAVAGRHDRAAEHFAAASKRLRYISQDGLANPALAVEALRYQIRQVESKLAAGDVNSATVAGRAAAAAGERLDSVGAAGAADALARITGLLADIARTRGDDVLATQLDGKARRAAVRAKCQAASKN